MRPLRRIIREYLDEHGRVIEVFECGHEQPQKQDIFGATNAYRRRCRRCGEAVTATRRTRNAHARVPSASEDGNETSS